MKHNLRMTKLNIRLITTWLVPPGVAAWVPWPNTILVREGHLSIAVVTHELVHCEQWARYGWRFPLVYLWQWAMAGFSYRGIRLEQEAEAASSDPYYLGWAREVLREGTQ